MNYIKEINVFYQRQETNPLSSNAANLWHVLLHINNRAGWIGKFTVAVSVLCSKGNLTNSTFKRARTELREKGYIRYESQSENWAAIYQVISSEESTMDHKVVPLLKQKGTKQSITTAAEQSLFSKRISE